MRSLRVRHISTSSRSLFWICVARLRAARPYAPKAQISHSTVRAWGNSWGCVCIHETQPKSLNNVPFYHIHAFLPSNLTPLHTAKINCCKGLVETKNQVDTHRLNVLNFAVDLIHMTAYDLLIVCQVHSQQVIVNQPERHLTCELSHYCGQLRNLVGRGLVQFVPGVHHRADVRVLLMGKYSTHWKPQLALLHPRSKGAMSWLTELLDVNLNETEGMPEKARKGYAALSILRGSKLENTHIRQMLNCGFLNVNI